MDRGSILGRLLSNGILAISNNTALGTTAGNQRFAPRYNKRVLVACYGGHVGLVSIAELKRTDSQGGANNIFWNADATP